jgi:predicted transcriptional regulator
MHITYDELREIKHRLPTGSVKKIADDLGLQEQTVRNYFGAKKFENGDIVDVHVQPGPSGGIVHLESTAILEAAKRILGEEEVLS